MISSSTTLPGTFGRERVVTLLASLLAALSAGTNYVFSAYGPQLGARLRISHTQLNLIGMGGNVGVYVSAPIWGKIVDTRGPQIPLLSAFLLLLTGYSGIKLIYDNGLSDFSESISTFTLCLLVSCSFMTGIGGNGGLSSAINTTAKTFPDTVRGSTTGLVISGFGLSAFLFSGVAHFAFPGDTSSFLLLLAIGTSFPMIVGYFFVRPIPLPPNEPTYYEHVEHGHVEAASLSPPVFHHDNDSRTHLLPQDEEVAISHQQVPTTPAEDYIPDARVSLELSPPRSMSPRSPRHRSRSGVRGRSVGSNGRIHFDRSPTNIHGRKLWFSMDFVILSITLSLLSGTGLMYINNVGSMSQALYVRENNATYDDRKASQWQATQVSTISFMNFSGRILIGLLSDFMKAQFELPRSNLLILVSFFMLCSQITASQIEQVGNLWKASALLGLGYGCVFSLYAAICIEWFGLPHFSENWGFLSLSPLFGGNLFSLAFGRNLDAHESPVPPPQTSLVSNTTDVPTKLPSRQCLEGRDCYIDTLYLTIGACCCAMLLSAWAGWRDRQRLRADERRHGTPEVIWEEPDE